MPKADQTWKAMSKAKEILADSFDSGVQEVIKKACATAVQSPHKLTPEQQEAFLDYVKPTEQQPQFNPIASRYACEYCDGIWDTNKHLTCPHCGAPASIRRKKEPEPPPLRVFELGGKKLIVPGRS